VNKAKKTKKVRVLRALAAKIFPEESLYHDWLAATFFAQDKAPRRTSTLQLSVAELNTGIRLLMACVNPQPKPAQRGRYTVRTLLGKITQRQADLISLLEDYLGWTENPERLRGFIKKQTGMDKEVQDLGNREASKVITGMKRILKGMETPA